MSPGQRLLVLALAATYAAMLATAALYALSLATH